MHVQEVGCTWSDGNKFCKIYHQRIHLKFYKSHVHVMKVRRPCHIATNTLLSSLPIPNNAPPKME